MNYGLELGWGKKGMVTSLKEIQDWPFLVKML